MMYYKFVWSSDLKLKNLGSFKQARDTGTVEKRIATSDGRTDGINGIDEIDGIGGTDGT